MSSRAQGSQMKYTVRIEEVVGGFRVDVDDADVPVAWCHKSHEIPQRVKGLFEIMYPKPEKGKKADKS